MLRAVRPWTEADIPAIRDVLWRSWESAYASFIPTRDLREYLDAAYTVEALRRLMSDPEISGYVGVREAEIVAIMRLRDHRVEGRTYVSSVYVVPEEQGTGWGNRLMYEAARQAISAGRREIWLGVMTQNAPALAWYRRHGFVETAQEPFMMGRTTIQHLIGYLPVTAFAEASRSIERGDEH